MFNSRFLMDLKWSGMRAGFVVAILMTAWFSFEVEMALSFVHLPAFFSVVFGPVFFIVLSHFLYMVTNNVMNVWKRESTYGKEPVYGPRENQAFGEIAMNIAFLVLLMSLSLHFLRLLWIDRPMEAWRAAFLFVFSTIPLISIHRLAFIGLFPDRLVRLFVLDEVWKPVRAKVRMVDR